MTTNLATTLDALAAVATKAGIDPDAAREEGKLLAAAVAEPAVGAFVDWARETGSEESATAFMDAAARGRRFRSSPTMIVTELRSKDEALAREYADALGAVCAAACLLGEANAQVAGAATMAAAAQQSTVMESRPTPPGIPPVDPAKDLPGSLPEESAQRDAQNPTLPVEQSAPRSFSDAASDAARDFAHKAPQVLNQVLSQLRDAQRNLWQIRPQGGPAGVQPPSTNPLDLNQLDQFAPGAFDFFGPAQSSQSPVSSQPAASTDPYQTASQEPAPDHLNQAAAPASVATQEDPNAKPIEENKPEEPTKTVDEWLAELDALTGLSSVKSEIRRQAALLRVEGLRKEAGLTSPTITRHLIFVGNPGTGKTTVARLVAGIYRALGLLSKGQLVEVDRSELVAGYLGQTAIKTAEVVKKAEGGVLFIDEAYALSGDQYGEEAINTLVKEMEDKRDNLVVIVAGYPIPMAEFIGNNPGLDSRFRTTILFEDYTDDELIDILKGMAAKAQYDLGDGVEAAVRAKLATQVRDFTFGNGRYIRNEMEAAIGRHAWRLRDEEKPTLAELRTLLPQDFEALPNSNDVIEWPDPTPESEVAYAMAEDAFDDESPTLDVDDTELLPKDTQ